MNWQEEASFNGAGNDGYTRRQEHERVKKSAIYRLTRGLKEDCSAKLGQPK